MPEIASIVHPADRLLAAIEAKRAPVCVGIDPVLEKLPHNLTCANHTGACSKTAEAVHRVHEFCTKVIHAVSPHVPCVKLQSACFERYGDMGVATLESAIATARRAGLQVILDAKRGDIGSSAEHYAAAAFEKSADEKDETADWITINSYLGEDGITPFLARKTCGAFALVRTSNPGGDAIQNLQLKDGRSVAQAVGELISKIGVQYIGHRRYSALGAVVGATKREDAKRLRDIMPQQIFLVPGYGAQGGSLEDVIPCFKSDGSGAIITASRSVIYAFDRDDSNWTDAVAEAASNFASEIASASSIR